MGVRRCPKCGSVWYSALLKCAFCGVEGEEIKGPISPAKLNLVGGGVSTAPPPDVRDPAPGSAAPAPETAEAPPPPLPPPPPKEESLPEPKPVRIEEPAQPPPPPPPIVKEEPVPVPPPPPPPPPAPARAPAPRLVPKIPAPTMPAPQIPSATVPLVFGALGILACAILPLMGALRQQRVVEILALLAFAILAPFAPFAWFSGQRYVDRCLALGFAPASAARTGKVMGMLASFLLVFEISALSLFVVVQALSGKIVCPLWK